jgi:succinoglycan biosynthesis transport protein ExoP
MSLSPRARRQSSSMDDFEDDDLEDNDGGRQVDQEKMKQLMLDLVGRWHWMALGLILGLLGGYYYLSKVPKSYEARATLLIKQQTATVMGRDQVDEIDLRSIEALNTVVERIRRQELMQKVASRPEIRALPGLIPKKVNWLPLWANEWIRGSKGELTKVQAVPSSVALAGSISSWTAISIRKGTRLLDISVTHPNPEVTKSIADAIAIEYKAEVTGGRSDSRSSSMQILVEESESARVRLQTAQNALANYQRALITLKELETREAATAELTRRYLPKHPRMIASNAELLSLQNRFLSEFNSSRTSTSDREYWDMHDKEWQEAAGDEAAKLLTARRLLLARGNVLESEIGSQTSVFNSILTRMQESDINKQAVESEVEISSLSQLPGVPVSPVATKVLLAGSVGGLAVGVLIAMLFIRMDNKIHTVIQVERESGLPVLAAVSEINISKVLAGIKRKPDTADGSEARKLWHPLLLFREGLNSTTYAEMFRVLRASVSLLGDEKKRRINLFSSALPGEGKTMVSSNFALASAQQGKRTLLVDLDLRKPAVHKVFGLKRDSHTKGVTDVLSGQAKFEEAVYSDTGAENLYVMLAGKTAPNPGELLNSKVLEEFLETALKYFDLVVLDSAPLLAVPDTRIVAPLADNFCLVVRGDYVPKAAVRRVISLLDHDNNLPSGIVFNGFSEKRRLIGQNYSYGNYQTSKYGNSYRYGYGSYGSYGSDET